jgi:hypothetical protein
MGSPAAHTLRVLEGDQVEVALVDGKKLTGFVLVSAGRLWTRSIWLVRDDADLFVDMADIAWVHRTAPRYEEAA